MGLLDLFRGKVYDDYKFFRLTATQRGESDRSYEAVVATKSESALDSHKQVLKHRWNVGRVKVKETSCFELGDSYLCSPSHLHVVGIYGKRLEDTVYEPTKFSDEHSSFNFDF